MKTRHGRWTELLLLVFAMIVGGAAVINVDLVVSNKIASDTWRILGGVALLLLAAHATVWWKARYADPFMLPIAASLNLLGIAEIHRLDLADAARAARNGSPPPSPDALAQVTWLALGLVLFAGVLILVRDHRRLQRYTYVYGLCGLILLLLPLAPVIGTTVNGATLWIRIGGFSFQPAELAKIALAIFFAGYLVRTRESLALIRRRVLGLGLPRGRDLGPILVVWVICLLILIAERDLGTSVLFFGLFVTLLYVATQRRSWLVIGALLLTVGGVFAYLSFGYVRVRVAIWLDPFAYANDEGYQIVQSLYSLGNGGILGTGLGQGYPSFVPFAKTDFIVAALGEELGLTGLFAIFLLFAMLVQRGLRAAVAVRDPFGTLLATGLSTVLALQFFVVVGGVTKLIPLTGLTTPFLSYGGSALIANWMTVALLLRISDAARRPDETTTTGALELPPLARTSGAAS